MASLFSQIKEEIRYEITGIIMVGFAVLSGVSLYTSANGGFYSAHAAGAVGEFLVRVLKGLGGDGKAILPIFLGFLGLKLMIDRKMSAVPQKLIGVIILYISLLAFFHQPFIIEGEYLLALKQGLSGLGGGIIGALLSVALYVMFGSVGSDIILVTLLIVALLLITDMSLVSIGKKILLVLSHNYALLREKLVGFIFTVVEEDEEKVQSPESNGPRTRSVNTNQQPKIVDHREDSGMEGELPGEIDSVDLGEAVVKPTKGKETDFREDNSHSSAGNAEPDGDIEGFALPPISLLQRPMRLKNPRMNKDISDKIKLLEETLESFGVKVKVTQVSRGPAITRYEMQPAPGVKVSKIVNLADDIALSLAASDVRIEAPIPGKAAIGIEVPNKEVAAVHFREVLETQDFSQSVSKLTVALGKDIAGNPIIADLGRMPHLLIAGATGSGKSVCMNSLIASLLYKCKPNELKFLMIDPKMVELTDYNGIPHLLAPVVTDAKRSATALRWIVNEMENRYELFAGAGVKDIDRYNHLKAKESPDETGPALPYIVVLIDELADLMMVAPADVEDAICRLAQMARAAGIHLVVATQRPSVDVITGVIKANIPSRIAFAVSSQTDSRTILDMGGAEKLMGRGDMLFFPTGAPKPVRVQGVFVSDKEINSVVQYLKKQGTPQYQENLFQHETEKKVVEEVEDELLPEAAKLLIESGQASISMLQRRLRIGYTRAARLIDIMEEKGIVGGYEGSKPRSVLMTLDEYYRTFKQE
ncbi:DNA translocase FtsK [Metallumcola ferriviriculae]|uniref:DNA translocase FtsK n=1 Tax=Metallumcola ferriviriculae TaxID=3039180 RepID=A0AAU0UP69_9FIRM|nr:DNA translocase FtsK [Desulfitibacteraceae bacterium MK1]